MLTVRLRFVSLWISQIARSLADTCLRSFVALQLVQLGQDGGSSRRLALIFSIGPFVLLAPVTGALSNSLPKRWLLFGSSAFCLCLTVFFGPLFSTGASTQHEFWFGCVLLGLVGIGHAVYSSAGYAILPAAAQDTRWPLNRIMGWIETRVISGLAGFLLALSLERDIYGLFPAAVAVAIAFDLVAVLTALPVHFPADLWRPEPAAQALAGFFGDCRVIAKDRAARGSLLGLAYFQALIVAATFADLELPVVALGLFVGCLVAAVQGHPRRMLGLVPPAALGLVAALVGLAAGFNPLWAWLLLGLMGGLINVPLRTMYQLATPAEMRGNGMALMNAAIGFSTLVPPLLLAEMQLPSTALPACFWLLVILAAAGAVVAWRVLLRETIEQLGEILLWPMYRIRAKGPGRYQIPLRGPLLVIANHTAWFDPLWLAKVLPRRLTPMMTSMFFDLPILTWLMKDVAGAIRVPSGSFRREAPELQEAVAMLDHGGCVLIFPEGAMKRTPEQALRHFGQGVWRILHQRPDTPVLVCWIEGGWGSFTSYSGGRPATNKRLDWWRPIDIAMETPLVLDPDLLADQQATRNYLMHTCLSARRHLGLEPLFMQQATSERPEHVAGEEDEEPS